MAKLILLKSDHQFILSLPASLETSKKFGWLYELCFVARSRGSDENLSSGINVKLQALRCTENPFLPLIRISYMRD